MFRIYDKSIMYIYPSTRNTHFVMYYRKVEFE